MRVLRSRAVSSNSDSSINNTSIKKSRRTKKRCSSNKNLHEESSSKENIRPKDENSIEDNQEKLKDDHSFENNETLKAPIISAVRHRKLSNKNLNVSISKEINQKPKVDDSILENEETTVSCGKQRRSSNKDTNEKSASKENQSFVKEKQEMPEHSESLSVSRDSVKKKRSSNKNLNKSAFKENKMPSIGENQETVINSRLSTVSLFNETQSSQLVDTSCILINDTTFEKSITKRNDTFEVNDASNINPNVTFEKINGTFEKIDNEMIQSRNRRSSRRDTYQIKNTSGQWSVEDISSDKSKEKSINQNDNSVIYVDTETISEKTLLKLPQNLNGTYDTPSKSNRKKWVKFEPETTLTTQSPILRKSDHFIRNKNSITSSTPFAKSHITPGKFDKSKNSVLKNKSLTETVGSKNSVARNKSLLEISSHSKSIKKSARKLGHVPNFAKIHQKIYNDLESVVEASERKKIRAEKLLSGKKPENPEPIKHKMIAKSSDQLFGKIIKKPMNTTTEVCDIKNSPRDKSFTIDKTAKKTLNSTTEFKNSPVDKKFTIGKNSSTATNINDIKNSPRDKSFTIDKTANKPSNSTAEFKNSPVDKKFTLGKNPSTATNIKDIKNSPKDKIFTSDKTGNKPLNSATELKNSPVDKKFTVGKIPKNSTATNVDDIKKSPKDKSFTIDKTIKKPLNSATEFKNSPVDKKFTVGKITKNPSASNVKDIKNSPKIVQKNVLSQIPRFKSKAIIIQKPKTPTPKLQINDKTLVINTTFSPKTEPNVKSAAIVKPQIVKSVFSKGHIQAVANKVKTSEKSAKIDNRRNQIKGVRSNRRFDLLMQMRGN